MQLERLMVEVNEGLGVIRLNHPATHNALGSKLIGELISVLNDLGHDPEVKVIVLLSALPKTFCAGRDLAEGAIKDVLEQRRFSTQLSDLWEIFHHLKKVTIAGVNGYALAGGCGLAASCDMVIASEDAIFGLPEINVGLFPTTIVPALLRSTGYLKKYFELFFTGDRFSAQEAELLGVVNRVVPADELQEKTLELARKIAQKSPAIMEIGKEFFYALKDMDFLNAMKYGRDIITLVAVSGDGLEGQKAFIEKRKPQWTTRSSS